MTCGLLALLWSADALANPTQQLVDSIVRAYGSGVPADVVEAAVLGNVDGPVRLSAAQLGQLQDAGASGSFIDVLTFRAIERVDLADTTTTSGREGALSGALDGRVYRGEGGEFEFCGGVFLFAGAKGGYSWGFYAFHDGLLYSEPYEPGMYANQPGRPENQDDGRMGIGFLVVDFHRGFEAVDGPPTAACEAADRLGVPLPALPEEYSHRGPECGEVLEARGFPAPWWMDPLSHCTVEDAAAGG